MMQQEHIIGQIRDRHAWVDLVFGTHNIDALPDMIDEVLRAREKQDALRFSKAKKQLVFYAKSGGQYKYYKTYIEYLLENSDIVIHYLTNDPNDALFNQKNERLIPYYASEGKSISLFLKLDTDIMVTTVPGLQSYHMKRSVVRNDIEYIFAPHSMGLIGMHFTSREASVDYYDTMFCVGPHFADFIRWREKQAGLSGKKLIKTGYGLYDQLVTSYKAQQRDSEAKPQILIAPSWQADNVLDFCIDDMLAGLLGRGYKIVIRPHPQYTQMFPERLDALINQYTDNIKTGELVFELDFSGNDSTFMSDVLISDWSNIVFEFSFSTLKPSISINTPMKILNLNHDKYGQDAPIVSLRDKIGLLIDVEDLGTLDEIIKKMISNKNAYEEKLQKIVQQYIFHPGRNGEAGGKYIISRLEAKDVI